MCTSECTGALQELARCPIWCVDEISQVSDNYNVYEGVYSSTAGAGQVPLHQVSDTYNVYE